MIVNLYSGNTHYVKLEDFHLEETSPIEYLDGNAVVSATIYNSVGVAVTDGTVTLGYIAASDGCFLGYLSSTADIDIDSMYTVRILVTRSGRVARYDVPAVCIYREGEDII